MPPNCQGGIFISSEELIIMVRVEDLCKSFDSPSGRVTVLSHASFCASKGEIVAIFGPSGAGKTTFLRCLSLLVRPDSGRIILDGEDLSRLSSKSLRKARQKMGVVFQGMNLLRSRNVAGNVMLPLEIRGVPRDRARMMVDETLRLVHIEHRRAFYPSRLSGGEKQRVAIARALVAAPKVLILDEPTSALDPVTAHSILTSLVEINRERGLTIIIVTHQVDMISPICNRVVRLTEGKLEDISIGCPSPTRHASLAERR